MSGPAGRSPRRPALALLLVLVTVATVATAATAVAAVYVVVVVVITAAATLKGDRCRSRSRVIIQRGEPLSLPSSPPRRPRADTRLRRRRRIVLLVLLLLLLLEPSVEAAASAAPDGAMPSGDMPAPAIDTGTGGGQHDLYHALVRSLEPPARLGGALEAGQVRELHDVRERPVGALHGSAIALRRDHSAADREDGVLVAHVDVVARVADVEHGLRHAHRDVAIAAAASTAAAHAAACSAAARAASLELGQLAIELGLRLALAVAIAVAVAVPIAAAPTVVIVGMDGEHRPLPTRRYMPQHRHRSPADWAPRLASRHQAEDALGAHPLVVRAPLARDLGLGRAIVEAHSTFERTLDALAERTGRAGRVAPARDARERAVGRPVQPGAVKVQVLLARVALHEEANTPARGAGGTAIFMHGRLLLGIVLAPVLERRHRDGNRGGRTEKVEPRERGDARVAARARARVLPRPRVDAAEAEPMPARVGAGDLILALHLGERGQADGAGIALRTALGVAATAQPPQRVQRIVPRHARRHQHVHRQLPTAPHEPIRHLPRRHRIPHKHPHQRLARAHLQHHRLARQRPHEHRLQLDQRRRPLRLAAAAHERALERALHLAALELALHLAAPELALHLAALELALEHLRLALERALDLPLRRDAVDHLRLAPLLHHRRARRLARRRARRSRDRRRRDRRRRDRLTPRNAPRSRGRATLNRTRARTLVLARALRRTRRRARRLARRLHLLENPRHGALEKLRLLRSLLALVLLPRLPRSLLPRTLALHAQLGLDRRRLDRRGRLERARQGVRVLEREPTHLLHRIARHDAPARVVPAPHLHDEALHHLVVTGCVGEELERAVAREALRLARSRHRSRHHCRHRCRHRCRYQSARRHRQSTTTRSTLGQTSGTTRSQCEQLAGQGCTPLRGYARSAR